MRTTTTTPLLALEFFPVLLASTKVVEEFYECFLTLHVEVDQRRRRHPRRTRTRTFTDHHQIHKGGARGHGEHVGDYLQPVGGLHLAAEGKLGKVFHEEKTSVVVVFLAVGTHFLARDREEIVLYKTVSFDPFLYLQGP
jgi:hypothetical protein